MSLINQVLKDLEKRHAGADEVRGEARAVRPLPEDVPRRGLWIALGLIVVSALAGGTWWFLVQPGPADVHPAPAAKITATPGTAAPAPVVAPAALPPTPANPLSPVVPEATSPVPTPAGATSDRATVPAPAPRATQEIAGLPQPTPNPVIATAPVTAPATRPVPLPLQAPAPTAAATESPVSDSTSPAPKAADKTTRKAKPSAIGSDRAGKMGLSGALPGEYPEPDGVERAPNIEKQVRPPSERERAEVEFRQGMAALQAGDPAEAEDRLRAALTIDPMADKARQALLGLYVERGRREDAERLLEDRLRLDRKQAGFAMALARLQLEHDANGDALVTLQRSLPFGETSVDYQVMLANALGRVGRHKEAAERFEAATRLAPRNPLWLMGLGVELRADGRPDEARAAFQRARELGGLNPQLVSFVDQQLRELK